MWITNTVYFNDQGVGTDADNLAQDVATLFATYRAYPTGWSSVNCRLYDMAEPAPREIQGEANAAANAAAGAPGPREVALCLSFHGDRNLPRQRGRIYVGPWTTAVMGERPAPATITVLQTLRQGLANIGGVDVQWCVYSPTDSIGGGTPVFRQVKAGWIDDEWDTIRSRGRKYTARNPWTMEG